MAATAAEVQAAFEEAAVDLEHGLEAQCACEPYLSSHSPNGRALRACALSGSDRARWREGVSCLWGMLFGASRLFARIEPGGGAPSTPRLRSGAQGSHLVLRLKATSARAGPNPKGSEQRVTNPPKRSYGGNVHSPAIGHHLGETTFPVC
jgi:hypothetical protein